MRRTPGFLFATLAVVSLLAYLPVFDNGFRRDDFAFLEQMVEYGGSWQVFAPIYRFAFFRPGAIALFQGEYALFHVHAAPYLVVNYLLHMATAFAGWRLLRRLGLDEWVSALAAGLFAVGFGHYGKTVMWAASAGSVVATLLCVVAVDLATGPLENARQRVALFAAVVLAPSFHEIGLLASVLVAARAWKRGGRWWCVAAAGLSLVGWTATWAALSHVYAPYAAAASKLPRVPIQLARYFSLFVLPVEESVTAPTRVQQIATVVAWLRIPVGVALAVGFVAFANALRPGRFLVLWILVALLPFTLVGLPGDGLQLRYTYTAALPFCAMAAVVLTRMRARRFAIGLATATVLYSVAIQVAIAWYYDRSTDSWLNRALRSELLELQEKVRERDRSGP